MKTCKNCGTNLKDDAVFCTECGTKIENGTEGVPESRKDESLMKIKEILKNKKIVTMSIIAVIAVIAIIAFTMNSAKAIKISDYYEVKFSGGNKFGYAAVDIDYDELEYAICEKLNYSVDSMKYWDIVDAVEGKGIKVSITPNENLKNGDEVEVKVEVANENMIKGIKLKGFSEKIKVEGLTEYREITDEELFKDIEVVYTEYSPYLEVKVLNRSNDNFLSTIHYNVEISGNIANGDTITIAALWDDSIAESNQCYVTGTGKKEIKVDGQGEYILNKEDITEDMLNQITQQIETDYNNSYEKQAFIKIKEIYLIDATNGSFEKNLLYVLMEVEPDKYGKGNWYYGSYNNITVTDGKVHLGECYSNPLFNFSDDASDFEEKIERYREDYKAVINLLGE